MEQRLDVRLRRKIMPTPSGHTIAIKSSRVVGTNVYNTGGEKIGTIEDIVLDKLSPRIMFAVISFGGFLGIGEKYHAVPWALLDFQEDKGGYVVPLTREVLEKAPVYDMEELIADDGMQARKEAYDYYRVKTDWH